MPALPQKFSPSKHEDMGSFELIPAGTYRAMVVESAVRDTKSLTGQYLFLSFVLIGGEYDGRKISAFINLVNLNEMAVEIASKELATLCRAVGLPGDIEDSDVLHNLPVMIAIGVELRKDTGAKGNRITGYAPDSAAAEGEQVTLTAADVSTVEAAAGDIPF